MQNYEASTKKLSWQEFDDLKKLISIRDHLDGVIVTPSMRPILEVGEAITIMHIEKISALKPFDIVVFWQNGILVSHYLVCFSQVGLRDGQLNLITRGLHGRIEDSPVPETHILGVVTSHQIPWFTRFWQTLKLWTSR